VAAAFAPEPGYLNTGHIPGIIPSGYHIYLRDDNHMTADIAFSEGSHGCDVQCHWPRCKKCVMPLGGSVLGELAICAEQLSRFERPWPRRSARLGSQKPLEFRRNACAFDKSQVLLEFFDQTLDELLGPSIILRNVFPGCEPFSVVE